MPRDSGIPPVSWLLYRYLCRQSTSRWAVCGMCRFVLGNVHQQQQQPRCAIKKNAATNCNSNSMRKDLNTEGKQWIMKTDTLTTKPNKNHKKTTKKTHNTQILPLSETKEPEKQRHHINKPHNGAQPKTTDNTHQQRRKTKHRSQN